MKVKNTGGADGSQGYEYQIVASLWVALWLMLEARVASAITVEPDNQEDLQADILGEATPDGKSVTLHVSDGQAMRAIFQMKTRSSRAWSANALQRVICGTNGAKGASAETRRRPRAAELLIEGADLSYTLVTDARVDRELAGLLSSTPPLARTDAEIPSTLLQKDMQNHATALRGRVHIIENLNEELLERRSLELLINKGKVPHINVVSCMATLKELFRQCMLGRRDNRFTIKELRSILAQYDARPVSGPEPGYVPPSIAALASKTLRERRCVLLIGPPDIGKRSLGNYLAQNFELDDLPCPVISLPSLDKLESRVFEEGPALLLAPDAWGTQAEAYPREVIDLPSLLARASAEKFLIATCDHEVYLRLPDSIRRRLQRYVLELEVSHYDNVAKWQIVLNQANLEGWQLTSLERARDAILRDLEEPFCLNLFGTLVKENAALMRAPALDSWSMGLSGEDECEFIDCFDDDLTTSADPNGDLFDDLARQALRDTLGYRAAKTIACYPTLPESHSVLLLGCYIAFASHNVLWPEQKLPVLEVRVAGVAQRAGLTLHISHFIDYLVKRRIVDRWPDGRVTLERAAVDGLRRLAADPAPEVQSVLAGVMYELIEDMKGDTFAKTVERAVTLVELAYFDCPPSSRVWNEIVATIDMRIEDALSVRSRNVFVINVEAAMEWRWGQSELSRLLYNLHPQRLAAGNHSSLVAKPNEYWELMHAILPVPASHQFIRRFLIDFLPYTWTNYNSVIDSFVSFMLESHAVHESHVLLALHALEDFTATDWGDDRWGNGDGMHNKPALLNLLSRCSPAPFVSRLPPPTPSWEL